MAPKGMVGKSESGNFAGLPSRPPDAKFRFLGNGRKRQNAKTRATSATSRMYDVISSRQDALKAPKILRRFAYLMRLRERYG
jgi:hypothetical protein